jgi:hypothetical protein
VAALRVRAGGFLWHERDVLDAAVRGVVGLITTPFFFEATVGFLGLMLVMLWNAWRRRRDGDGWVEVNWEEED